MSRTYQTPAGQTVELDERVFGDHLSCTGCTTDWQAPVGAGPKDAATHAANCRDEPERSR